MSIDIDDNTKKQNQRRSSLYTKFKWMETDGLLESQKWFVIKSQFKQVKCDQIHMRYTTKQLILAEIA